MKSFFKNNFFDKVYYLSYFDKNNNLKSCCFSKCFTKKEVYKQALIWDFKKIQIFENKEDFLKVHKKRQLKKWGDKYEYIRRTIYKSR